MDSRISNAVENKNCGYNCADALICAYCDAAEFLEEELNK